MQPRPPQFDALILEQALERRGSSIVVAYLARGDALVETMDGQAPGCLADVPLDWVQAVTADRDVRRPNVLGGRQQVLDADRDQGRERDLERPAWQVDILPRRANR